MRGPRGCVFRYDAIQTARWTLTLTTTEKAFRYFFGLGFGNKTGAAMIGNKGLGTKLYFNSDRVEVATRLQSGAGYLATLDRPLTQLLSGRAPEYTIRHTTK